MNDDDSVVVVDVAVAADVATIGIRSDGQENTNSYSDTNTCSNNKNSVVTSKTSKRCFFEIAVTAISVGDISGSMIEIIQRTWSLFAVVVVVVAITATVIITTILFTYRASTHATRPMQHPHCP